MDNDGADNGTCGESCDTYDCTVEADMFTCVSTYCYDTCTEMTTCDVEFQVDDRSTSEYMTCDDFEATYINGDNSTVDCTDEAHTIPCTEFISLSDFHSLPVCNIETSYNSCDIENFSCLISGDDGRGGVFGQDCSEDFKNATEWS